MTTRKVLHFTIGPVQDFIADSRRLRDYWTGSFLLSLLSGHAMKAVKQEGGVILFPETTGDELFEALEKMNSGASVYIGSLPNRFKADVSQVDSDIGAVAKQAVEDAWKAICNVIWTDYLFSVDSLGNGTRSIWERQTGNFWDIAWAIGEEATDDATQKDGAWLDMRKNWRILRPSIAEDGDHCRLMGQYQELSGYHRIGEKDLQDKFWNKVREKVGGQGNRNDGTLNIGKDERLCALAFIKRVFPICLKEHGAIPEAIGWLPGRDGVNIRNWPSTSYIAALPWLKNNEENWNYHQEIAENYVEIVKEVKGKYGFGETETKLFGFQDDEFFKLDGHLFHESGVEAYAKEFELSDTDKQTLFEAYGNLVQALSLDKKKPSPFYAILRMDGDGIGGLLEQYPEVIKLGLAKFTQSAKDYFNPDQGNPRLGTLIYAGGDDVLAFLPVDTAITAACDLRDAYRKAFVEACEKNRCPNDAQKFTLSASIVYSHFKSPMSAALRLSSEQLDDVAKDENGRNSLALCVAKPGGIAASWVNVFGDQATSEQDSALELQLMVHDGLTGEGDATISGSYFHGFNAKYQKLVAGDTAETDDTVVDALFTDDQGKDNGLLKALILSELKQQFSGKGRLDEELANKTANQILRILKPTMRKKLENGSHEKIQHPGIVFDGGLVMRFLAQQCFRCSTSKLSNNGDNTGSERS